MRLKWIKGSFCLLLCFSLTCPTMAKPPETVSEGVILIEPKTNTILYEKNAHQKFYPASITKIMTALIIAEEMPINTIITKSANSMARVPSDSSSIGLEVGDRYNMTNALHGLLLGSDNYIAYDLARTHSGSIAAFADKMNTRAKSYRAQNTHFSNPHGYHDPNHYTTPYDMAQIAKVAFANPTVAKIAGKATAPFSFQNQNRTLSLTNTSRLLKSQTPYYNPHVVACKTGFHDAAQQTLVAKAVYNDLELIAVVMKTSTPNQYIDINHLFEYGSTHFAIQKTSTGYKLLNHTMSDWAKPSIDTALQLGWISSTGVDYQSPIEVQDLIWILKHIPVLKSLRATDITNLTQLSLTDSVDRKTMAQIMYHLNRQLSLIQPLSRTSITVSDLGTLSSSQQTAIEFVLSKQLMTPDATGHFYPEKDVTWEEAICTLYKYFAFA